MPRLTFNYKDEDYYFEFGSTWAQIKVIQPLLKISDALFIKVGRWLPLDPPIPINFDEVDPQNFQKSLVISVYPAKLVPSTINRENFNLSAVKILQNPLKKEDLPPLCTNGILSTTIEVPLLEFLDSTFPSFKCLLEAKILHKSIKEATFDYEISVAGHSAPTEDALGSLFFNVSLNLSEVLGV